MKNKHASSSTRVMVSNDFAPAITNPKLRDFRFVLLQLILINIGSIVMSYFSWVELIGSQSLSGSGYRGLGISHGCFAFTDHCN